MLGPPVSSLPLFLLLYLSSHRGHPTPPTPTAFAPLTTCLCAPCLSCLPCLPTGTRSLWPVRRGLHGALSQPLLCLPSSWALLPLGWPWLLPQCPGPSHLFSTPGLPSDPSPVPAHLFPGHFGLRCLPNPAPGPCLHPLLRFPFLSPKPTTRDTCSPPPTHTHTHRVTDLTYTHTHTHTQSLT